MSAPISGEAPLALQPDEPEPPARVIANSAWSLLSQAISVVVAGGVSVYAARTFTPSSWGHYSTALALIGLFTVLSGAGIAPRVLRELAANRNQGAGDTLGLGLLALGMTAGAAAVVLIPVALALGYPHQVLVLVVVLMPFLLLDPALSSFAAVFTARFRQDYAARFQIAQTLVYGALGILVVWTGHGVVALAAASLAGGLCAGALAPHLLRTRLRVSPRLRQSARSALMFARAALPIAGMGVVTVVYERVDVLMLSVLSSSTSVARYAVAYGFVRLSWIIPSVVSAAFYPLLIRKIQSQSPDAEDLFFLVVRLFLFASIPISLLLAVMSPVLVPFVFGPQYAGSASILQVMAWTSVFGFQGYILWYGMLAIRQERAALGVQVGGLIVNVGLNAFAIPLWGPSGAAAALVASDLLVVVGQAIVIHRKLFRIPTRALLAKPLALGIVIAPGAVLLARTSPVAGAVVGAGAYWGSMLALRYVEPAEWSPATTTIRQVFARLGRRA